MKFARIGSWTSLWRKWNPHAWWALYRALRWSLLLFRIAVGFAPRRDCVFAKESLCYYAGNPNMDGCLQCSSVDIVMVNKSATPKSRRACEVCSGWLLDKLLAKVCLGVARVEPRLYFKSLC